MRRHHWIILALVVVTVGVFWRVAGHDFVNYDDTDYVTQNAHVQAGVTRAGLAWAFGTLHGTATYWHPLTWLSHMLDCQRFGLKPMGHHLGNLLFHTINSVLVFLLFRRMTGAEWRSAVLAGLFALHPLQVETVAWVAERKNVLSTMFWLLTTLAYACYAGRPGVGRYGLVLLLFILGLMSKPMLVTLPCTLLLLDYWPLRRFPFSPAAKPVGFGVPPSGGSRDVPAKAGTPNEGSSESPEPTFARASTLQLVLEKLPLFAFAGAIAVLTILAHRGLGMTNFDYGLDFNKRVDNALVSYVRYLGKTFWPSDLSVLYFHPGKWPSLAVGLSLFALILISGLILRDWRRVPYLSVGWLWFMGTLVPVIGLIQVGVQAMANRFAYVPLIGLFLALVWGLGDWFATWKRGEFAAKATSAAALIACIIASSVYLGYWKNSETLFGYAVRVAPNNFVAHNNLAYTFIEQGKLDRALEHAQAALRVRRDFPEAQYQAGAVLNAQDKPIDAIPYLREAVRLDPKWATPRTELARALNKIGQPDEAIQQYEEALRLLPADAQARRELAALLQRRNRTAETIAQYREALKLQPNSPEALNNLAWLLATDPRPEFRNGAEAVHLAEQACELTGRKKAFFLGTLAAAYAEAGRFDEAVKTAEQARDIAKAAGEQQVADANTKLLELYRARKPFREELQR